MDKALATTKKSSLLSKSLAVLISLVSLITIAGCSFYLLKDNAKFKDLIGQETEKGENNNEDGDSDEPEVEATLRSKYDLIYLWQDKELYKKNLETLETIKLTDSAGGGVISFVISPDMKKVAYTAYPIDYVDRITVANNGDYDPPVMPLSIFELNLETGETEVVIQHDTLVFDSLSTFSVLTKAPHILGYKYDSNEIMYRDNGIFIYNNETKATKNITLETDKTDACKLSSFAWYKPFQVAFYGCIEFATLESLYTAEGESFIHANTVNNFAFAINSINHIEQIMDDGTALVRYVEYVQDSSVPGMGFRPVTTKFVWMDLSNETVIKEVAFENLPAFRSNTVVDENTKDVYVVVENSDKIFTLVKYNAQTNSLENLKVLDFADLYASDIQISQGGNFIFFSKSTFANNYIDTREYWIYDVATDELILFDTQKIAEVESAWDSRKVKFIARDL